MSGARLDVRAVIFDLGNVLIQLVPLDLLARRGAAPIPGGDPLERLRSDSAIDRYERGQATPEEFCGAVRRIFGDGLTDASIHEAYDAILGEPVPGMAELVLDLRERGVRVVGLSDISPGHLAVVRRYPAVAALERVVASCETGHRKPEPEAFRAALRHLGTPPAGTLFVDDRPENVAGAAALGLRALVFAGAVELRRELDLPPRPPPRR